MMQTELPPLPSSPSFSSYSSETLAQIAARVIHELRIDPHYQNDDSPFASWPQNDDNAHDDDSEDFEFALVSRDPNSSPVSADDIFYNGQIIPTTTYPLFGRDILNNDVVSEPKAQPAVPRRRTPLRMLMLEERETASCRSSNSENENELKGVEEGSYCVWTPQQCKKSKSSGSSSNSKRWKLRDLILRSHSDGKEPFLFLGPTKWSNKVAPKRGTSALSGGR